MKLSRIIANTGEWLSGAGPHDQIVVSSRVRLARNLKGKPFPGWAKKAERVSVLEEIRGAVEGLPEMEESFSEKLVDLSPLEKQVLVERHLIRAKLKQMPEPEIGKIPTNGSSGETTTPSEES